MIEFNTAIFAWPCVLSDHPRALVDYHLERGEMPLHGAVGVNCKRGATKKIKAHVPGIWANGGVLP